MYSYAEQRRGMMQDWANRLDLLEQGEVEAASRHLIVRLQGGRRWPGGVIELYSAREYMRHIPWKFVGNKPCRIRRRT